MSGPHPSSRRTVTARRTRWRWLVGAAMAVVMAATSTVSYTAFADQTVIFPPDYYPANAIHTYYGDRCLTAPEAYNGAQLTLLTCDYGSTQAWDFAFVGMNHGLVVITIRARASGMCLDADTSTLPVNDVNDGSQYAGSVAQLWTCNGEVQQSWVLLTRDGMPASRHEATNAWDNADQMFSLVSLKAIDPGFIRELELQGGTRRYILNPGLAAWRIGDVGGFEGQNVRLEHVPSPELAAIHGVEFSGGNADAYWDSPSLQCLYAFGIAQANYSGRISDGRTTVTYSCPV